MRSFRIKTVYRKGNGWGGYTIKNKTEKRLKEEN